MKKIASIALAIVFLLIQIPAGVAEPGEGATIDAYSPDEMRVPWFGTGVDWLEGSGLNLLTLETEGMEISDGYCVTGVTTGSVIKLEGVDFGEKGPAKGYIRANTGSETGFQMEIRVDSEDGPLLGTAVRDEATAGGWSSGTDEVAAAFDITEEITGVHTLYLINATGAMNFFGVYFDEKEAVQSPTINAYAPDEMRVPWFGTGVDWLEGSGLDLLTLETEGMEISDGYCVTGVTTGSVMKLEGVDFGGKGPAKGYLRGSTGTDVGYTMEIRLDSKDGPLLGVAVCLKEEAKGWDATDQVSAEFTVSADVSGVHTLYFINTSGAMNFFGVHFDEKTVTESPIINAYAPDEMRVPWFGTGVDWLEGSGLNLLTLETEGMEISDGYCVTGVTTGSVMKLEGVDFGEKGPAKGYIRANTGNETGFQMEIRLDSEDGPLLGTASRSTATAEGWNSGTDEVAAEFEITEKVTGIHTVYLVNTSGAMNFFGVHFDEKDDAGEDLPPEKPAEDRIDAYTPGGILVKNVGLAVGGEVISVVQGGGTDGGYIIEGTGTGTVIELLGLNFGEVSPLKASLYGNTGNESGFSVELRLDRADGPLIGTFSRDTATDGGWSSGADAVAAAIELSQSITGIHNLYLIYTSGSLNFYGLSFAAEQDSGEEDLPPEKPAEDRIDAYTEDGILVKNAGLTAGGDVISVVRGNGTDGGYIIADSSPGMIIELLGLNFGTNSPIEASFLGNTGHNEGFRIELRLDRADGPLVGTFSRDSATDGGWGGSSEGIAATLDITVEINGVHNLYLVYRDGYANFYGLSFTKENSGSQPEDPPPPEKPAEDRIDAYTQGGILVKNAGLTAGGNVISVVSGNGTDGGYIIESTGPGTIIELLGLNFSDTVPKEASFYGNTGNATGFTVELRLDSAGGPLLGTFSRDTATDGGWSSGADAVACTMTLNKKISGIHNLYLVFVTGSANFFGISFAAEEGQGETLPPEKPAEDRIDAYTKEGILVQSVGGTAGGNVISVVKGSGTDDGYVVSDTSPGTIIELLGLNFGSVSPKEVSLMGNTGHNEGFVFELRLDRADGPLVGILSRDTATSGGWSSGADAVAAALDIQQTITGVHNLYLVLKSGYANFYGLAFYKNAGEADSLPPRKPAEDRIDAYTKGGLLVRSIGVGVGGDIMSVVAGKGLMGDYIVESASAGTIIEILGVNFGGVSPKEACLMGNTGDTSGFTVELRLDGADGPIIGVFTRDTATDGGWSSGADSVAATTRIDEPVTGVHNLYLVFTQGYANFYGISFFQEEGEGTRLPPEKPAVEKVNAYEDDIFVSNVGVGAGGDVISVVAGNGTDGDYVISDTGPGTIIEILGVSFGDYSPTKANFFGNTGHNEGFRIELRLDKADGETIGVFTRDTPTDGGWSSGADKIAASFDITSATTGVHNLYLVYMEGYANFYGISFETAELNDGDEDEVLNTVIPYVVDKGAGETPFHRWILPVCIAGGIVLLGGGAAAAVLVLRKKRRRTRTEH